MNILALKSHGPGDFWSKKNWNHNLDTIMYLSYILQCSPILSVPGKTNFETSIEQSFYLNFEEFQAILGGKKRYYWQLILWLLP